MDGWWDEIDRELCGCLRKYGTMTPRELGRELGMPEGAVTSLVAVLAREGKVRIATVELVEPEQHRAHV